jgi:hypothetical protein
LGPVVQTNAVRASFGFCLMACGIAFAFAMRARTLQALLRGALFFLLVWDMTILRVPALVRDLVVPARGCRERPALAAADRNLRHVDCAHVGGTDRPLYHDDLERLRYLARRGSAAHIAKRHLAAYLVSGPQPCCGSHAHTPP